MRIHTFTINTLFFELNCENNSWTKIIKLKSLKVLALEVGALKVFQDPRFFYSIIDSFFESYNIRKPLFAYIATRIRFTLKRNEQNGARAKENIACFRWNYLFFTITRSARHSPFRKFLFSFRTCSFFARNSITAIQSKRVEKPFFFRFRANGTHLVYNIANIHTYDAILRTLIRCCTRFKSNSRKMQFDFDSEIFLPMLLLLKIK